MHNPGFRRYREICYELPAVRAGSAVVSGAGAEPAGSRQPIPRFEKHRVFAGERFAERRNGRMLFQIAGNQEVAQREHHKPESGRRQLDRSEICALVALLPKQLPRDAIAESLLQLSSDPQRPLPAAVVDRLWERTLRDQTAARFHQIIESVPASAPGPIHDGQIEQTSGRR